MSEQWRDSYDDWKLRSPYDEAEERDRREQEREDAEIRAELRAEAEREEHDQGTGNQDW